MIYLFTGVPGAGKTLNAIRFIDTDTRFKNRPVFFHNIDGCSMSGWTEITLDQAKDWHSLPTGAVIVIDEAYKFAPVGATGVRPADYIEKLAEHRHQGIDFIFICQHPHQIHTFVRKMIGNHFHIERQFGFNRSRILEWQEVKNDPTDYHARQLAITKIQSFDKKYFAKYKSAEIHTHKPKIPFKLIMVGALALFVSVGIWAFTDKLSSRAEDIKSKAADTAVSVVNESYASTTIHDPINNQLPRIKDQPWTAPIYDELTKPKTFPKPNCIQNHKKQECRCYSQQGTRLEMSSRSCVDIVRYGWFDPTKTDGDESQPKRVEAGRQAQLPPPTRLPNSKLVTDSTYYRSTSL